MRRLRGSAPSFPRPRWRRRPARPVDIRLAISPAPAQHNLLRRSRCCLSWQLLCLRLQLLGDVVEFRHRPNLDPSRAELHRAGPWRTPAGCRPRFPPRAPRWRRCRVGSPLSAATGLNGGFGCTCRHADISRGAHGAPIGRGGPVVVYGFLPRQSPICPAPISWPRTWRYT